MDLNKLRDEAYQIAKEHGWHDKEYSDSHWIMLIITEIAEAVQAHRKGDYADDRSFELQTLQGEDFKTSFELHIKNSVEDELSDVVIRCLDLAGLRKFDLSEVTHLAGQYEGLKEGIGFVDICYSLSGIATSYDSTDEKVIAILAAVLRYCELTGIDLEWFIEQKMKYNRLRPYMHGDKRY